MSLCACGCGQQVKGTYARGHNQRVRNNAPTRPLEERFWEKVQPTGACWLWTAGTARGYGRFGVATGDVQPAHRVAYELLVGPVPDGLVLDHLCRITQCVNPDHLEPVTDEENLARGYPKPPPRHQEAKTQCPQGHPYDEANTYRTPAGHRRCRTCHRAETRARRKTSRHKAGRKATAALTESRNNHV